jgi:Tfp pilus assembly protein PilO
VKLKKPLPKPAVIGAIVGAGLLVAVLGWLLVVSPQNTKATALQAETADVQQKITEQLAAVAAAKNLNAAPKIRVADVYKLAKAIPSAADMPNLLLELSRVAEESGVELTSIAPGQPKVESGGGSSIPISLSVNGDFFTLTDLLYRLRNLVSVQDGALLASGRLFSVDNVALTPAGGDALSASISMHTYVYGAPPAAAVPVTPAPAGTDTTTTTEAPTGGATATGAP